MVDAQLMDGQALAFARRASTRPAPSARWLADRIAFAPGMAAVVVGLGERRTSALDAFVRALEARWGQGQVLLGGTAFIGTVFVSRAWAGEKRLGSSLTEL